jgi:hypothetical protein
MSDPEHGLARWSRLKREAAARGKAVEEMDTAAAPPSAGAAAAPERPGEAGRSPAADSAGKVSAPAFNLADLPSLDSIGPGTDIRAFLQAGVPEALTRAALRRAWTTDPAIRDFIEIAENQWDFNNPASVPGFGDLDPGKRDNLVARAFGTDDNPPEVPAQTDVPSTEHSSMRPEPQREESEEGAVAAEAQSGGRGRETPLEAMPVAMQHKNSEELNAVRQDESLPRRRHGTALPSALRRR